MDINSFTAAFTSVEGISAWSTEKKNKARCSKIFLHAHPPSINSYMFGSFWTVPPSTVTALNDRDQVDWLQILCNSSVLVARRQQRTCQHIRITSEHWFLSEDIYLCLSPHFRCGNRPNMHYDYARSIVSCACHMQTIAPAIRGILGAPRGWPWTKNGRKAVPAKMVQRYSEQWLLCNLMMELHVWQILFTCLGPSIPISCWFACAKCKSHVNATCFVYVFSRVLPFYAVNTHSFPSLPLGLHFPAALNFTRWLQVLLSCVSCATAKVQAEHWWHCFKAWC